LHLASVIVIDGVWLDEIFRAAFYRLRDDSPVFPPVEQRVSVRLRAAKQGFGPLVESD
jgi:hypothetical protein